MQPTKDLLLNKHAGRGYISYTTQSKDQAPVPGKRFTAIGVPGATVPPEVFAQDKRFLTSTEVEAEKTGSNGETGLSAVEPTKEEYRQIAETRPGAEILPDTKKSQAEQKTEIPRREHQTANGGVMPTRNASGDVAQQVNTPSAEQPTGTPKPRVPGADIQVNHRAIRKQSRDLADRVTGINDIMRVVNKAYPQQTEEDTETQQRREKRNALLATIGDGLSSFHEAYAKMRGVQPMTNGTSLTGRMRDRRERMDRERQEIDAKRQALAINWAKLKQQQRTAEDMADYRQAQSEYWANQGKKWENDFKIQQQKAAEQERSNKAKEAEKERSDKANEAIRDKRRQDQKSAAANAEAGRNARAAKSEAGKQARYNQSRADRQEKDKKKRQSKTRV